MKSQEIELWAREIVDSILKGHPVEDSRVELKAKWIEAEKAAPRLAGHANASRGESILWLIGVDERNSFLTNVDHTEKGAWYKAVEKCFDGFAPRLLVDVNFRISGNTVVALYFDTEIEAPYIIKNSKGGFPEYIVPWRTGTDLRAASRANLLTLLVPVRRLSSLLNEIDFNRTVAKTNFGCVFRSQDFFQALQDGVIESLPRCIREKVKTVYVAIELSNQKTIGYHQFSGNWGARGVLGEEAKSSFDTAANALEELHDLLEGQNIANNIIQTG